MPMLPPTSILLAPPARGNGPCQWSLADETRPCLEDIEEPRRKSRSVLSPLRSARRNSASHVPACILPTPSTSVCDENGWYSSRPVPLSARSMGFLAKEHADKLRLERMRGYELPRSKKLLKVLSKAEATSDIDDQGRLPAPRFRRHSVNLPPIRLEASPREMRPATSPPARRRSPALGHIEEHEEPRSSSSTSSRS